MTSTRAWAIAARYGRAVKRQSAGLSSAASAVAAVAFCAGCSADAPAGPALATTTHGWTFEGVAGYEITSPHYRLRTTVRDPAVIDHFVRVMESAYAQYAALVPPASTDTTPLDAYLFATPGEWEAYTRRLTGPQSAVYLSVGPGGYAYGDRFVCWLFNENDLWGVAAHEGFHQYVARHLPVRMPPALEEGLATTFENVRVTDRRVEIDRQSNPRRQGGLETIAKAGAGLSVAELVTMHAGDIAGQSLAVREGFYGQCWALARLLAESPDRAAGLRRMLIDLRDGRNEGVGRATIGGLYRPAAGRPLLGRYVAPDWTEFERTYRSAVVRMTGTTGRSE